MSGGVGPNFFTKGLIAGPNVTIVDGGSSLTISTTSGGITASVTTNDATQTLLQTIPLPTASRVYDIENTVIARSGTDGAKFIINTTFKRDAGTTVSQIGTIPFSKRDKDVAAESWTVDFNPVASGVEVLVTGALATTIEWTVTTEVRESN